MKTGKSLETRIEKLEQHMSQVTGDVLVIDKYTPISAKSPYTAPNGKQYTSKDDLCRDYRVISIEFRPTDEQVNNPHFFDDIDEHPEKKRFLRMLK